MTKVSPCRLSKFAERRFQLLQLLSKNSRDLEVLKAATSVELADPRLL